MAIKHYSKKTSPQRVSRLQHELKILSLCRSSYILGCDTCFLDEEGFWVVKELMSRDLAELIDCQASWSRIDESQTSRIIFDASFTFHNNLSLNLSIGIIWSALSYQQSNHSLRCFIGLDPCVARWSCQAQFVTVISAARICMLTHVRQFQFGNFSER